MLSLGARRAVSVKASVSSRTAAIVHTTRGTDPGPSSLKRIPRSEGLDSAIWQFSRRLHVSTPEISSVAKRKKLFTSRPTEWRSFYSSSIADQPRAAPRWLNTRETREKSQSDILAGQAAAKAETMDGKAASIVRAQSSENDDSASSSANSGSAPPASSSSSGSDGGEGSPPPDAPPPAPAHATSITKASVPEYYPQVLALPIARRPLFPGFYKAVVVRNPAVVAAIREMMKRGQPYLGAFLLKDENNDADVITDLNDVHPVGVFAQITSVFNIQQPGGNSGSGESEEGLTAVLYPHRRIKITDLVQAGTAGTATATIEPAEGTEVAEAESIQEAIQEPTPPPSPVPASGDLSESSDGTADIVSHRAPMQTSFLHDYAVSLVNVDNMTHEPYNNQDSHIRAFTEELIVVFREIAQLNTLFRDQVTTFSVSSVVSNVFDVPDRLADFAAAVSSAGDVRELQDVLESMDIRDRLRRALIVLKKELINAQLQSKLSREVDTKIAKRQREYYLMEQLKGIKKELGMESDGKDKLIEKFKERAASLKMPDAVRKVFDEELNKLQHLEPAASEANVTRTYLEWLTQIPWGQHSPENYNIANAVKVLEEDHYGLKDVKDRILEFLAVGKLRGTVEGKIICLVGPPGVGKTSIGKSIARALNRQFFRFSVGGLTDVAEIKGHRRTYVGALPSKIIQALKRVGVENPLVLIDEVDKIGRGINGDPSSALLEMLDPEQNSAFLDHYMDVPVDLSRVLFVCTANVLDTIPAPLLDRMEVLEVSGYVTEEKAQIAERYLGPQAKEASGLKEADVLLDPAAVDTLIKYYCRESGVRNLKKHIEKIYRKAAFNLVKELGEDAFPEQAVLPANPTDATGEQKTVENQTTPPNAPKSETTSADPASSSTSASSEEKTVTTEERKPMKVPDTVHVRITPETLKDYVGPPVYHKDRMYVNTPPPGVSTGLGYLGNGSGAVMPIEATSMPGKGALQLTGKLGEVIRESAQIGLSWVKAHAYELGVTKGPDDQFLNDRDIHIHMPEGSIGKEGPSAGTAILSALVSLFTKTRINPDIAMTGEISLVGQVLPVGGLKEKILAAHRAGIKTILAPAANRADIEENVPDSVKTGIRFVYVEDVREVLAEVFRGEPAAERWKDTLPP